MASRFKLARAGAGITGAAAMLLMAAAVPASAEPVTATVDGGALGLNVNVGDGFKSDLSTQLIGLNLDDGSKLGVYCVEIDTGLDRAQPLVEKDWDDYPVEDSPFRENADQINWILHNGFPEKQTGELAKVLTERCWSTRRSCARRSRSTSPAWSAGSSANWADSGTASLRWTQWPSPDLTVRGSSTPFRFT